MNTGFAKSAGNRIGAFLEELLLFLIAVAGQASIAAAQSGGTFTATGSMTSARAGHTATLLFNGKVLIAGGYQHGYPALAGAELYDPSTGTFTATGDMTAARAGHTATSLTDGRVLIAGGVGGGEASAELYDPSTGTFTATGGMITPDPFHTATLLGNGKVLIAGGYPTAELYDPATGTFAVTGAYAGSYTGPLYVFTATLLLDGRVLITGCDCGSNGSKTAALTELYDPATGTFSPAGTMTGTVRGWYAESDTATLLRNGTVLIVGGGGDPWSYGPDLPADAEMYDPSPGKFTGIGNTAAPHSYSTATLLPDGTVLIAGSTIAGGNGIASAELYAPTAGAFYATGNMTTGRNSHTATLLRDGTVLIAGGSSATPNSSAELYHPAGIQFTPKVQIVDNNTGSLTTLAVGDSFSVQVTGAPPVSLVSVSETGWSGSVGYTDASGLFFLYGIVGSNVVGTWQQTWTIGGVLAQPGPLQFTITPKP